MWLWLHQRIDSVPPVIPKISVMPATKLITSKVLYVKFVAMLTLVTKRGMALPLLRETQSIPHHQFLVDVLAKQVDAMYQVTLLKSIIGEQLPFLF